MNIRLISAPISIAYSEVDGNEDAFAREYEKTSQVNGDPVSQWLKVAMARGETEESDKVVLNLLIELYRKVDSIDKQLKNEASPLIKLQNEAEIESIGYNHFKIVNAVLQDGTSYYGRVDMPMHPKRDISIYFKAIDSSLAEITKIHTRDDKEWSTYLVSRERTLIREMKEAKYTY